MFKYSFPQIGVSCSCRRKKNNPGASAARFHLVAIAVQVFMSNTTNRICQQPEVNQDGAKPEHKSVI